MDYFSNRDKDIFLINLPKMIDRGALMSRYSRAVDTDLRSLWDKEFSGKEEKGEKFYERVFLEYGDESIAELVTAQVGVQNVTNVASKIIEEGRIGLSYIEKSSRYVPYDRKENGRYLYEKPERIGIPSEFHDEFNDFCDSLFESYSTILNEVINFIRQNYSIENTEFRLPGGQQVKYGTDGEIDETLRKSYETSVKSRALDEARFILPSSTLTNIGLSGNARGFAHLLERLKSVSTEETDRIYEGLMREMKSVFPKLIDSVESDYGKRTVNYLNSMNDYIPADIGKISSGNDELVKLIRHEPEIISMESLIAAHYFQRTWGEYLNILENVKELPLEEKRKIVESIASLRKTRREKPDRSLEHISYTFQINTNFGAFRELQRHRILSLQRKLISTEYGYETPPFISKIPEASELYVREMEKAKKLYEKIKTINKFAAQYVVPFGFRYPVVITSNLRELVYFTELRSTPQAHFDLRKISKEIAEKVKEVNPSVYPFFKFVNTKEEQLGRLQAEVRKELKKKSL